MLYGIKYHPGDSNSKAKIEFKAFDNELPEGYTKFEDQPADLFQKAFVVYQRDNPNVNRYLPQASPKAGFKVNAEDIPVNIRGKLNTVLPNDQKIRAGGSNVDNDDEDPPILDIPLMEYEDDDDDPEEEVDQQEQRNNQQQNQNNSQSGSGLNVTGNTPRRTGSLEIDDNDDASLTSDNEEVSNKKEVKAKSSKETKDPKHPGDIKEPYDIAGATFSGNTWLTMAFGALSSLAFSQPRLLADRKQLHLARSYRKMKKAFIKANETIKGVNDKCNTIQSKINGNEAKIKANKSELSKLSNKLMLMKERKKELEKAPTPRNREQTEKIDALGKKISTLDTKVKGIISENKSLASKVKGLKSEQKDLLDRAVSDFQKAKKCLDKFIKHDHLSKILGEKAFNYYKSKKEKLDKHSKYYAGQESSMDLTLSDLCNKLDISKNQYEEYSKQLNNLNDKGISNKKSNNYNTCQKEHGKKYNSNHKKKVPKVKKKQINENSGLRPGGMTNS